MSDMKCPFCQQEMIGCMTLPICHFDPNCPIHDNPVPVEVLELLDRTKKQLEIAVDALKEQQRWIGVIRVSLISHLNNEYGTAFKSYDADPTVVNTKRARDMLNTALEQITALEQKD